MKAIIALASLAALAAAEEMKFVYNLPPMQNICFLQNIAENIQGKLECLTIRSYHRGHAARLTKLSDDSQRP